jgi:NADPH:quinone reductase-like Zn-dependent oxidoreductase
MMNSWIIESHGSPEGLTLVTPPEPEPPPGHVLIRFRAISLNYRDLLTLKLARPGNLPPPLVPCSDGAGEIVSVGEGVTRWKTGDRVMGTFFQQWTAGGMQREVMRSALGGPLQGVLTELRVLSEEGIVRIPEHLSFEEASTLPCAALTAWHALVGSRPVFAGQTVLILGTGGVSLFALQFAKLHGARVLLVSRSEEKLAKASALGADETLHSEATPDWEKWAFERTDRTGVDHVIEVGGAATLGKSMEAVRYGGRISLIGVLGGFDERVNPWPIIAKSISLRGIYVGPRALFETMNQALALHKVRPVMDRIFKWQEARDAFKHLESGRHFGKIVIST